ncbi:MAG: DUF4276 family protein [Dehalococcoidales bacterium]|nr:DUF4276 family protein [Dehalococcoidales bacterium]
MRGERMHFEILVEDQSGKQAIDILIPKIIGDTNTFKVRSYKGIGHIPKNLTPASEPNKRILLDQLPRLINGYGKSHKEIHDQFALIIVCDLDQKCMKAFRDELLTILEKCQHKPNTNFCFAIEEGEAWFLGDIEAVKQAYPKGKYHLLRNYQNDSICGTWEMLADAIYPGGRKSLSKKGYQEIGKVKSEWARKIAQHMNTDINSSPSFNYFKNKLVTIISSSQ